MPRLASSLAPQPIYRLRVLGTFAVEGEQGPVRLPTRKLESLLAYLALHPGPHPREHLATLLWGDTADALAQNSLRNAFANLRKRLGSEIVWTDRECAQLNPAYPLRVDARELEQLADCVKGDPDCPDAGAGDAASAYQSSQAAGSLYAGDLLADFYDDWITPDREHYRALYLNLLLDLAGQLRSASEYAQAIEVARQALACDPANERAFQQLMFCYVSNGDRAAALKAFEECKRALETELAVEPARETQALYSWIKQSPGEAREAGVTNLPIPLTSFIGRKRERAELKHLIVGDKRGPGPRLVTLTGSGGAGKTRLAIQAATELIGEFKDGVWWVNLAPIADPAMVPQAVAKSLGVQEAPSQSVADALVAFLRLRQLLIVLDNCEHLVAACAQLCESLLTACPRLRILTTSREGLGLTGEVAWRVPSLSLPVTEPAPSIFEQRPVDPARLMEAESVQLFVERARAAGANIRLTGQTAPAVAQICRRLDGMPLALEMAAARTKVISPAEIATRLDDRFSLLTHGSRTALPRQQTLRAVMDWSYDLLASKERALFTRLSPFAGSFSLDAAEAVASGEVLAPGEILDLLSQLVDKSLVTVQHDEHEARYGMLETVREYAQERCDPECRARVADRHLAYFARWVAEAEPNLRGPKMVEWFKRIDPDLDNLRVALAHASNSRQVEAGLRIAAGLGVYWQERGLGREGRRWLEALIRTDGPLSAVLLARAHYQLGWLTFNQGDYPAARSSYEASLAVERGAGNKAGMARVLNMLAGISWVEGDYAGAQRLLQEGLTLYREVNDAIGTGSALSNLGILAAFDKDYTAARAYLLESLALVKPAGDQLRMANVIINLAQVEQVDGQYAKAREYLLQSLDLYQLIEARPGMVRTLHSFATLASAEGHAQNAVLLFGAVEALREAIGLPVVASEQQEYEASVKAAREALGSAAFDAAWAKGRTLDLEQAIALARK